MSIPQILLLFYEDGTAGLRLAGTERVHQVLREGMAMSLYGHNHEHVNQMFLVVFVDKKLYIGYVNGLATYTMGCRHGILNPLGSSNVASKCFQDAVSFPCNYVLGRVYVNEADVL